MAKFKCINGKTYEVPEKSCLVCGHCTDIFVDFIHGPYMVFCDNYSNTDNGVNGNCNDFIEEDKYESIYS